MFLNKLREDNPALIDMAMALHDSGDVLADSYVVDLDQLFENARKLLDKAKSLDIDLFFMLKQLGRNPYIGSKLVEMGYPGAVAVDFSEGLLYIKNKIPIMNLGHLVQPPIRLLSKFMSYGVGAFTVYGEDMIKEINAVAGELGYKQAIMLKLIDDGDVIYPGQESGIFLKDLPDLLDAIKKNYNNIYIKGLTAFPCFLFNEKTNDIEATPNTATVLKGRDILAKAGFACEWLDLPSASCFYNLDKIHDLDGNIAEPGHGLTGTSPLHAVSNQVEKTCVLYITEVSHSFRGHSYCFGGGLYRRGHMKNALVGRSWQETGIQATPSDAIDYHFCLDGHFELGLPVVAAFRFQIFVTRSRLVLIEGLKSGKARILGTYGPLGQVL